jgi:hypothetical protein
MPRNASLLNRVEDMQLNHTARRWFWGWYLSVYLDVTLRCQWDEFELDRTAILFQIVVFES